MTDETELREVTKGPGSRELSVRRDSLTRAQLEFSRGAGRLAMGSAGTSDLLRARFDGPIPHVSVADGSVMVTYPRLSPGSWVRPWGVRGGQVSLNEDVTWHLRVRGGVAHLDADLRGVPVEAIDLGQGGSHVELRLPRPTGAVPVRVSGGASHLLISRPAGTPARLRIDRGVSNLMFDDQEFGALGGRLRLESPQADEADDRYDIEISGGAAHVRVTTE